MKDWELTPELEDTICLRISQGESLRGICRDEGMPSRDTVLRWILKSPEFATKHARAREWQAEWINDDMAEIEDKVITGAIDTNAAKVVIGSKQWRAAKLAPKKYGDRISTELSGPDGGPVKTDMIISLPPDTVAAVTGYAERLRAKIKPPIEPDAE